MKVESYVLATIINRNAIGNVARTGSFVNILIMIEERYVKLLVKVKTFDCTEGTLHDVRD